MLSGAKHLRGDSSGLLSLRMTVPFMVMLRSKATKHLIDSSASGLTSLRMTEKRMLRMTFNVTFVRTKVTKSRRADTRKIPDP